MDDITRTPFESKLAAALHAEATQWTPECVDPEDLLLYVEQGEKTPNAAFIKAHLEKCAFCRREYVETQQIWEEARQRNKPDATPLRLVKSASSAQPEPVRSEESANPGSLAGMAQSVRRWMFATAGVAALLLLSLATQSRTYKQATEANTRLAQVRQQQSADAAELIRQKQQLTQVSKERQQELSAHAAEVAELKRQLASQPPANNTGGLPRSVAKALETGVASLPADSQLIIDRAMGNGTSQEEKIELESPVATAVLDARPRLKITPLTGASGYTYDLYQLYNLTAKKPVLSRRSATEWQPNKPLVPGVVYEWRVRAKKDGEEVVSPTARFRVLDSKRATALKREVKEYIGLPVTEGILYAEAGLFDLAEQKWRSVSKANTQYGVAQKLLANLKKRNASLE